jgi:hypothetical protein
MRGLTETGKKACRWKLKMAGTTRDNLQQLELKFLRDSKKVRLNRRTGMDF